MEYKHEQMSIIMQGHSLLKVLIYFTLKGLRKKYVVYLYRKPYSKTKI